MPPHKQVILPDCIKSLLKGQFVSHQKRTVAGHVARSLHVSTHTHTHTRMLHCVCVCVQKIKYVDRPYEVVKFKQVSRAPAHHTICHTHTHAITHSLSCSHTINSTTSLSLLLSYNQFNNINLTRPLCKVER